jgi:hypothetical protein
MKKTISLGSNKFPLMKRAKFFWGKRHVPHGAMNFPLERPKFPRKHMFQIFFVIITILCSLLYRLMTYHYKCLEKNYNFVFEGTLIKIHMKSYNHTKFWKHLFSREHLKPASPCGTWMLLPSIWQRFNKTRLRYLLSFESWFSNYFWRERTKI